MNLSFSTRGWSHLSWGELVDAADEMHFGGIELYNIQERPELTDRGGPFHQYSVVSTLRALRERKLEIPCVDTSFDVSAADDDTVESMERMIALTSDLRSPYMAVTAKRDDLDRVCAVLERLIPTAEEKGVTILIKTSGLFADTSRLRDVLNHFACDQLAVLWNVHHPYREKGETPAQTITNLGAYIKHVHLRDSGDDGEFALIGEGTLPVEDVMRALYSVDYDGYISMEWKPEWLEELTDYEVISPTLSTT